MTRNIIAIDLDSCIGCHSCAVVCKQENNVGLGTYYNKVLTVGPFGTYPDLEMYYLPVACQHCDNPECVSVCPTGASYRREDVVTFPSGMVMLIPSSVLFGLCGSYLKSAFLKDKLLSRS